MTLKDDAYLDHHLDRRRRRNVKGGSKAFWMLGWRVGCRTELFESEAGLHSREDITQ